MTAEFSINIPGAEIIKRLVDLEQQVSGLAAIQTRLDAQEQRLVELAMTYAPVTYVDKQMELLSGRIYRRLTDEVAVLKDLIKGKIVPAPNKPVDTSWHPYDAADPRDIHPADETRVVVMDRNGEIYGPERAANCNWSEYGLATIVAWRYAKEGE